jgi:hypothetical protein
VHAASVHILEGKDTPKGGDYLAIFRLTACHCSGNRPRRQIALAGICSQI